MGLPVVTVAAGGLPIVESTSGLGTPVTESAIGLGVAVTKVIAPKPGLPVIFVTEAGVVVPPVTYATLDGTPTNVSLSNGNLTATHTTSTTNSGARSTAYKSSGKYYFEATFTQRSGDADCVGVLLQGAPYSNFVAAATQCTSVVGWNGGIFSNGATTGAAIGIITAGNVVSMAVDLDARKAWFRKNGGNWNGQAIGSQNPATGVGGVVVAAGSYGPAIGFGGASAAIGDNTTINLGASAFVYAVPSTFTAGWPT